MYFPGMLKRVLKLLNTKISDNLISEFKACGIFPLDPLQVTKRLNVVQNKSSSDSSWLSSFEYLLNGRRTKDSHTTSKTQEI